jgi:predicted chitinase
MEYELTTNEKKYIKKIYCIYNEFKDSFKYLHLSEWQMATIITHIKHESKFNYRLKETLKYSKKRFKEVFTSWKYREAVKRGLLPCKNKECERELGDIVYKHIGGYNYRGKSLIQLTGKKEYKRVLKRLNKILNTDIKLSEFHKLITKNESIAILSVLIYFDLNKLSRYKYFIHTFKFLNPYLPMKDKLKRFRTFNRVYGALKRSTLKNVLDEVKTCFKFDFKG